MPEHKKPGLIELVSIAIEAPKEGLTFNFRAFESSNLTPLGKGLDSGSLLSN